MRTIRRYFEADIMHSNPHGSRIKTEKIPCADPDRVLDVARMIAKSAEVVGIRQIIEYRVEDRQEWNGVAPWDSQDMRGMMKNG